MNYREYKAHTYWGKIMESSKMETIDIEMYILENLVKDRDTKGFSTFHDTNLDVTDTISHDELQDCINVRRKRVFTLVASFLDLPVTTMED